MKPPRREAWRCFVLAPALLMMGCAAIQPSNPLAMDCGDLVVIGRVETLGRQAESAATPLPGWQSRYDLQIRIKKVVRATESKKAVPATAIAHAQPRGYADFLLVLTPDNLGGYVIKTAQVNSLRPRLKDLCAG